jgi:hypothetical protein
MIDPTPNEEAAMQAGGEAAGAYLESLGKSDLAQLAVDEWLTLIKAVVTGYSDRLRALAAQDRRRIDNLTDEVPF